MQQTKYIYIQPNHFSPDRKRNDPPITGNRVCRKKRRRKKRNNWCERRLHFSSNYWWVYSCILCSLLSFNWWFISDCLREAQFYADFRSNLSRPAEKKTKAHLLLGGSRVWVFGSLSSHYTLWRNVCIFLVFSHREPLAKTTQPKTYTLKPLNHRHNVTVSI